MVKDHLAEIEQINRSGSSGLWAKFIVDQGGNWHYHPEFEIMLNIKCNGTRVVGDRIEIFDHFDLVIVPPNIPHCWNYYKNGDALPEKHGIVAHFDKNIFGDILMYQHEMSMVRSLFDDSRRGVSFPAEIARETFRFMEGMTVTAGIEKIINFLNVLRILCNSTSMRKLCSENYRVDLEDNEENEMAEAYNYIREHYREPLSLGEISKIAGMKPFSFSKNFKRYTGSGVIEFVNQVRTDRACYLLRESRSPINDIADECGFSSISNFNKQFRKIMGTSPKTYRAQYMIRN